MAEPRYATGRTAEVKVGSVAIRVTDWDATGSTQWEDTTDTGSAGYETSIPAIDKCSGSFKGSLNLDLLPTSSPGLRQGVNLSNAKFYLERSGKYLDVPLLAIDSVQITSEVKGVIKFTCNWHANGAFTWPT